MTVKPIKWPCDWNRPLSKEEQAIARRLDRIPEPLPQPKSDPLPKREWFDVEVG